MLLVVSWLAFDERWMMACWWCPIFWWYSVFGIETEEGGRRQQRHNAVLRCENELLRRKLLNNGIQF